MMEGRSATVDQTTPVLQLRGVSKRFFGVEVLSDVDLDAYAGEVHAIVGENGAGKSTLMKVVAGVHQPEQGTIAVDGEQVVFDHPRTAQRHGIGIIYQEFNLLPERTVAQNIFLGREPKRLGRVDAGSMEKETAHLLEQLHVSTISPRSLIRDLSVAQQQMIEIAKALSLNARVLIMDEPTASLSSAEADALFERVDRLREQGFVVLYISHRLEEIFRLAQRISVLKDGHKVGTVAVDEVTATDLVRMMVGRDLEHYFPERAQAEDIGDVRVRVRGGGNDRLSSIDLDLRAGEILGVAGLEGSGRTELARAIFGVAPLERGELEVDGEKVRMRSPRQAIRRGLGFITEDRKGEGLVLPRSVLDNGTLPLRSLRGKDRARRTAGESVRGIVGSLLHKVDVRTRSYETEVRFLSGGNQQKVVLAKWLATRAEVLIFDEPTRGIDVGAKAGIHELMRDLARQGKAILMISSELPEVIGMSDRILVMRAGSIAGELPAGAGEHEIMLLAAAAGEDGEPAAVDVPASGATSAPSGGESG